MTYAEHFNNLDSRFIKSFKAALLLYGISFKQIVAMAALQNYGFGTQI